MCTGQWRKAESVNYLQYPRFRQGYYINTKEKSLLEERVLNRSPMEAASLEVAAGLVSQGFPKPSAQFLSSLLASQRVLPPAAALIATAKVRLLSSDFTQPNVLDSSIFAFPPDITNPAIKEFKLTGPIPVQVMGVEDISRSRWEQIVAIEAHERGETTKGREIIRVAAAEEGGDGMPALPAAVRGSGPHKIVLQDVKGQRVYGFELRPVPKIEVGMSIGTKLVLMRCVVARGVVLLEPGTIVILGGKVEAAHKAWVENRKKELKEAIGIAP
jgi:RecQ-mediated genome instability protein 1